MPDYPGIDVGAQVERQPEGMSSRRLEAVDNLDPPKPASQSYRSAVAQGWCECTVAVVLGGPRR